MGAKAEIVTIQLSIEYSRNAHEQFIETVKVEGEFGSIMYSSYTVRRCGTIVEKA